MSYFNNKEVVITGGAGFLATHFITELNKLGANITTHTHNSLVQYEVIYKVHLETSPYLEMYLMRVLEMK